ncbi:hypothetical protein F4809DRAFT_659839 [Biscogniauxia mediterranea]|nr:hypothetical protein F4809DRAFT_659839 [Biscogniauxia mediterranea]
MEPIDTFFAKLSVLHEDIIDDRLRNTIVASALSEFVQAQVQEPTNDPLATCVWRLAKQLDQHHGADTEHHLKVTLAPFAIDQPLKSISSTSSHRDRYLAFLKWIIHGRRDDERPDLRGRPRRSGGGSPSQQAQCSYLYEHFTNHRLCAKCGTGSASLQCAKCLVTEDGHPLVVTYYCSVGCQAADLCYHRQVCQPLKRFHRAARLARDLYARLAEATYVNGPVDTICADAGLVHVARDGSFDRILRGDSMIVPFERDRFDNPDHAAAALYDIQGPHQTQATSAGRSFLNMFIRTQCVKVREVHFRPKNAAFGYAGTVPVSVGRGCAAAVYSMLEEHGVFVATLRTGHEVVVDVAGAQFGWREPMALWHDYLRVRCQQITHETEGVGRACRAFRRAQGPHSPLAAVRGLRRAVMVRVVNEVMAWVVREHRSFFHFVRQPDAAYRAAHDTAVAIAERVCAEEVDANHRLGLFRLFRLFNGGVKVTRTWEEAAQMQEMWLTDEEIAQVDENEDPERRAIRLIDMYEHKVRDYYRDTGVDAIHQSARQDVSMIACRQRDESADSGDDAIASSPTLRYRDEIAPGDDME